ncbi:MAG: DUF2330 domain-containing protein [Candidatus Latescibacteria bacterium]|nr:DUF2330 domain-containing protein [Candidatus Latescibacterota bacterium]
MKYARLLVGLQALGLLLLTEAEEVEACGGFFCSNAPMNQVGERILFIPEDGVVTTHVQIQYSGSAADFAWVLPVPSVPQVQVSHNELFRQLDFATQPFFALNWEGGDECGFLSPFFRDGDVLATAEAVDDGVEVVSQARVGPYDTAVIRSDDPNAMVDWLVDNGYQLGDVGPQLLAPYVEEGFFFLALRLAPDREVGDLQPISLTYEADRPGIPIRLTAVATQPDMGVLVWVLGSNRAIPANYLHVQINEARIDWFNGGFNYSQVVSEAANEAGGQAFATDFAGGSRIMDQRLYSEGRYDIGPLRGIDEAPALLEGLLRQGFPRDNQMQALLRRHIPMSQRVLEEGVLQVVFGGDKEAYERAAEDGQLAFIAESSFYNNMAAYEEYTIGDEYDLSALLDELEAVVVEPLRAAQGLFEDYPYLTRLYTTMSAEEMTVDPMFDFNPDLPEVPNVRWADARFECPQGDPEDVNPEEWILVVTLADGREVRTRPFADSDPFGNLPAAALIERVDTSGPPEPIRRLTAVQSIDLTGGPTRFALLKNYPNPFNSGTVLPFRVTLPEGEQAEATLRIFNALGQPVRTLWKGRVEQGFSQINWDGLDEDGAAVPSGTYFYQLDAGSTSLSRKLMLVR